MNCDKLFIKVKSLYSKANTEALTIVGNPNEWWIEYETVVVSPIFVRDVDECYIKEGTDVVSEELKPLLLDLEIPFKNNKYDIAEV